VHDPTLVALAAPRGLRLLLLDLAAGAGPAAQRAKQAGLACFAGLRALGTFCRRALLSARLRRLLVVCILVVAVDSAGQRL
jgi:hypothetical protein